MLLEVAALFLKLGVVGFGGPAAHVALMHREVVHRRGWLDEQEFLDMLGATNLLPGPNSTELAMHIGRRHAGRLGLVVAGVCFIGPAALMMLGLAWVYVRYGTTPAARDLLYGIKPVVIAVVAHALYSLGRRAVRTPLLGVIAAAAVIAPLLGVHELVVLVVAGTVASAAKSSGAVRFILPLALPSTTSIFLTFLKIGAVTYGSGYVLLAFLRRDLPWLTDTQLLDAVAAGQFTPGPLFTTATFIGYLGGGFAGSAVATVGIFLPAFVFVALIGPIISRVRNRPAVGAFLDGVNAAAVGLMAAVTITLARDAIVDPITIALALAAAVALFWRRINPMIVMGAGLAVGVVRALL